MGIEQLRIHKIFRTSHGQEVAAAKVGISVRSVHLFDGKEALPSQRDARIWRTRADPFDAVWYSEIVPMLRRGR